MKFKLLIDMNLSPQWVELFKKHDIPTVHWSTVGDPKAPDRAIMEWAKAHDHIVFTHDLDFGSILAVTQAAGPSVIQVRTQDVLPESLGGLVIANLKKYEKQLNRGAIMVMDELTDRVRILPLVR